MGDNWTCVAGTKLQPGKPCSVCGALPRDGCRREGSVPDAHEATIAALRAENERLNKINRRLVDHANWLNLDGSRLEAHRDILQARVREIETALEFYATAWTTHPGDSGPGGNTPQDPVCDPDDALIEDGGRRARNALDALPTLEPAKEPCKTCGGTSEVYSGLLGEMRGCPDCQEADHA